MSTLGCDKDTLLEETAAKDNDRDNIPLQSDFVPFCAREPRLASRRRRDRLAVDNYETMQTVNRADPLPGAQQLVRVYCLPGLVSILSTDSITRASISPPAPPQSFPSKDDLLHSLLKTAFPLSLLRVHHSPSTESALTPFSSGSFYTQVTWHRAFGRVCGSLN